MGIDGIGKGGHPKVPDAHGDVGKPGRADRRDAADAPFAVQPPDTSSAPTRAGALDAAEITSSSPLGRLRAGEIDVDRYVDLKVDEATRGLVGLSPAELEDIKGVLRDQVVTDPALSDLVRNATGHVPTPNDD
jgi:hypothetical protein